MNALARFRAWIATAVAGDSDRGIPIAETVQWVALVFGGASLLSIVAVFLEFPDRTWRIAIALGCLLLNACALALVRTGRPRAGALVMVSSCFVSLTLALAMTGGVSVASQSGLVLAICCAGLLLGRRTSFVLAALSTIEGPLFSGLQLGTTLNEGVSVAGQGLWMMQAAIFFSAAALVSITVSHAERALARAKRSENRFRALADNMQDIIVEFDSEDRFAYANRAFLKRLGTTSLDDFRDRRLGYTTHPEDMERVVAVLRQVRDAGESARFSTRVLALTGVTAIVDVSAGGIVDENGERRVVTVSRDVTAKRAMEDALRDSEERYRMLAEHAPDMIVEHDALGRIVYANAAARTAGYEESEFAAHSYGEWNHPDDVEKCRKAFEDAMTQNRVIRLVHRLRHKDGTYRWVSSSGAPYRTSKGEMHLVGQSRDITEEVALQEQLRQAQKMEAIGRLAGGVAHDFNNLLTVIGGYAGVLESSAALDPRAQEAAQEIAAAAERAAGLTRQLLALSRRQLAKSQIVDLNAVLRGIEPVLRRALPESLELELVLDGDLPPVEADPSQLDQVILNLALNARDAMTSRGRLRIETRRGEGGHSLQLFVSDTGAGMSEATRLRAFEPFFTTKPAGEGSGLGLSTTYGIVQQIGGSISLDSAPGCGTRVAIELPAAEAIVSHPTALARAPAAGPARDAGILLVEDDRSVRRLLTLMLRGSGYRVVAAASGDEALVLADAGALEIDLVLSDYVLPGLSGVELCVELRKRFPGVRVVLMTGHAEVPANGAASLPEGAELLGKPFTREQLQQLLDRQLAAT
ncbi:MAG: PAS domain S-box protein [Myxococcota bacterium]